MADYKYNPPAKDNPSPNPGGSENGGARIWNVFQSTIVLDELSLPEAPQSTEKGQKVENYASMEYPLIKINDYLLSKGEIDLLQIDSNDRVPTITLSATFNNELFLSKNMPKDGDIISVAIRSKADVLKPIRNDYVITGVLTTKRNTNRGGSISITFFGELFLPGWRAYWGDPSKKGTTMEVLKKSAKELGLGFNTNEENTDDKQIWISYDVQSEILDEIVSRAWKDEDSFFDWWIDVYYNFNFVNVQKQLLSSEQQIDEAAVIGNVPMEYYWGADESEVAGTAKVFSNYAGFRTTSFFIRNWRPINKSSQISINYGTSIVCNFFEHNNILYEDPSRQKYWELDIAPDYDPDKIDSHILLRGRAKWDASINNDEPARANYDYTDIYKRYPWLGIQYTLTNPDDDQSQWNGNHHKNYMRAQIHNLINLAELEKLNVEIEVQGTNLNIIRGDKVPIVLIKKDRIEGMLVSSDFNTPEVLEFFYSGWYYVKGFSITYSPEDPEEVLSSFSQTFLLTRREWPTPVPTESRNNT